MRDSRYVVLKLVLIFTQFIADTQVVDPHLFFFQSFKRVNHIQVPWAPRLQPLITPMQSLAKIQHMIIYTLFFFSFFVYYSSFERFGPHANH